MERGPAYTAPRMYMGWWAGRKSLLCLVRRLLVVPLPRWYAYQAEATREVRLPAFECEAYICECICDLGMLSIRDTAGCIDGL